MGKQPPVEKRLSAIITVPSVYVAGLRGQTARYAQSAPWASAKIAKTTPKARKIAPTSKPGLPEPGAGALKRSETTDPKNAR